jgi:uncharacterized protein YodC (DUF2158 family)
VSNKITQNNEGDIVKLKSGGPDMTIKSVEDNGYVNCNWFAGRKLEQGRFKEAQILPVEAEAQ